MEEFLNLIKQHQLETIFLALLVNFLTSIFKRPIKALVKNSKNRTNITRFIVFLPIIIGFGVVYAYRYFIFQKVQFDDGFIRQWITATGLSLSIYALVEKFIPSKNQISR